MSHEISRSGHKLAWILTNIKKYIYFFNFSKAFFYSLYASHYILWRSTSLSNISSLLFSHIFFSQISFSMISILTIISIDMKHLFSELTISYYYYTFFILFFFIVLFKIIWFHKYIASLRLLYVYDHLIILHMEFSLSC